MTTYSTTLASLIQSVAYSFDDCTVCTPSSTGTTGTAICTSLLRANDYYNGMDIHFYSGALIDTTREVTDFVLSTYTMTFLPAVGTAVAVTDLFQLHKKFKYKQYFDAVNRAIQMAKNEYLLDKKDDTAYINRLTNYDFESATTGWTISGAGASEAISTTHAGLRTYSLAVTSASVDCYSYQAVSNPANYRGKTMTVSCWVWCDTASKAYVSCYDGVTNHGATSYHTGSEDWEELTTTFTVAEDATELTVRLGVKSGTITAYFDLPILAESSAVELTIPTGFKYISEIWYESAAGSNDFDCEISPLRWWIVKDATTPLIRFADVYPLGTGFRIIGQSLQSALTGDASVCYMPPEYVIQTARGLLMLQRPEYEKLMAPTMSVAGNERRNMGICPYPGSRGVWEL